LNFKEILELIDKVSSSGISAVEVEQAGTKVRIEGKSAHPHVIHSYATDARSEGPMLMQSLTAAAAPPQQAAIAPAEESEADLEIITSPIVGTFYRAPNPEADAFVNVGDRVSKGKVLCIVEAMKLMNEIECDADGVVARIYPQNGQPVEYGEKLFAIRV
jgi:acetyl-CoA carboxylase biotin carboxyl carrier protein